jgi:hypothetical protein
VSYQEFSTGDACVEQHGLVNSLGNWCQLSHWLQLWWQLQFVLAATTGTDTNDEATWQVSETRDMHYLDSSTSLQ